MVNNYLNQSISSGTLRQQDLIDTFARTLQGLDADNGTTKNATLIADANLMVRDLTKDNPSDATIEEAIWVMEELEDALSSYASEGFYFGAHMGDGSDFGFWESDEQ